MKRPILFIALILTGTTLLNAQSERLSPYKYYLYDAEKKFVLQDSITSDPSKSKVGYYKGRNSNSLVDLIEYYFDSDVTPLFRSVFFYPYQAVRSEEITGEFGNYSTIYYGNGETPRLTENYRNNRLSSRIFYSANGLKSCVEVYSSAEGKLTLLTFYNDKGKKVREDFYRSGIYVDSYIYKYKDNKLSSKILIDKEDIYYEAFYDIVNGKVTLKKIITHKISAEKSIYQFSDAGFYKE